MSDFFSKLEAKRKRAALTESMTIRVTVEEDAIIKELASVFDLTRQDLIHDLIVEYLLPAWRKVESDSTPTAPPPPRDDGRLFHYVLNTNKANSSEDHEAMLSEGIAAAFEDGYKEKIDRIKKSDMVFLYESAGGLWVTVWPMVSPRSVIILVFRARLVSSVSMASSGSASQCQRKRFANA